MEKLFFEKLVEGIVSERYTYAIEDKGCDYAGSQMYLGVINSDNIKVLSMPISETQVKMLEFLIEDFKEEFTDKIKEVR